jgi:hypothetical protein
MNAVRYAIPTSAAMGGIDTVECFAKKRLHRDLKELLVEQPTMTTVSALPTQNMLE